MCNCPLFVLFCPILDFAFLAGLFSLFRRAVFAFSPGCFFAGLIFTDRPFPAGLFSLSVTLRIEGLRCLLRHRRGRESGNPRRGTAAMEARIGSFPLSRRRQLSAPSLQESRCPIFSNCRVCPVRLRLVYSPAGTPGCCLRCLSSLHSRGGLANPRSRPSSLPRFLPGG